MQARGQRTELEGGWSGWDVNHGSGAELNLTRCLKPGIRLGEFIGLHRVCARSHIPSHISQNPSSSSSRPRRPQSQSRRHFPQIGNKGAGRHPCSRQVQSGVSFLQGLNIACITTSRRTKQCAPLTMLVKSHPRCACLDFERGADTSQRVFTLQQQLQCAHRDNIPKPLRTSHRNDSAPGAEAYYEMHVVTTT